MGILKSDGFALTISKEGKTDIFPSAYLIIHVVLIFKAKLEELKSVVEVQTGKHFLDIFIMNPESFKCPWLD